MRFATSVFAAVLALGACGGKLPETRYYQLATPAPTKPTGTLKIVLEPLTAESAYDDERIVYRVNPYRLDYYNYHRWSAPPGVIVGNYLEAALEQTGQFRAVVRELDTDAHAVLSGRVIAIEEVDTSKTRWQGRIVLELRLADARSGETLWLEQFEESEPLPLQTPEGLARALSAALSRIVEQATPIITQHATAVAQKYATSPAMAKDDTRR